MALTYPSTEGSIRAAFVPSVTASAGGLGSEDFGASLTGLSCPGRGSGIAVSTISTGRSCASSTRAASVNSSGSGVAELSGGTLAQALAR